jgi:hypothetical protein
MRKMFKVLRQLNAQQTNQNSYNCGTQGMRKA